MIGQGDYLQAQVNYTEGALRYIFQTPNSNWGKVSGSSCRIRCADRRSRMRVPSRPPQTDLSLTTAWNVNAAYEHFWNPQWRTSLYGGYAAVSYSASGNAIVSLRWAAATVAQVAVCNCHAGLRQRLADLVARFAHAMERHQGLLHGLRRVVRKIEQRVDV